jgi:hypothetical protein
MENLAFSFLRQFKTVEPETEKLVMRFAAYKVNNNELLSVFEDGVSGKYGKFYSADPQTLITWIKEFLKTKNAPSNYLSTGLTPVTVPDYENIDWYREANKCYLAFMNGVNESYFHPAVYDRMLLDGKINLNDYKENYDGPKDASPLNELLWKEVLNAVKSAKQKCLKKVFANYKNKGYNTVYNVKC